MEQIRFENRQIMEKLSKVNGDFLEFVQHNPDSFKRSHFKLLELNDPLFTLQPWPTFINWESKKAFGDAVVKLFNLIKGLLKRRFNNDPEKISEYYKMPIFQVKLQMEGVTDEHLEKLLARGDFILTASGLKCLEYNVSACLGGWQVPLWESLYLNTSIIDRFLWKYDVKTKNENLLYLLLEHLFHVGLSNVSDGDGEINIAVVTREFVEQRSNETYLKKLYEEIVNREPMGLKGDLFICDFKHLTPTNSYIFYEDKKIHVLVEMYNGLTSKEVMKAFKDGNIHLINGPITALMSSKLNLALLSDYNNTGIFTVEEKEIIDTYVPWTRKVTLRPTTYGNETITNPEHFILANRERLVLKPSMGMGGTGVCVGPKSLETEWEEVVRTAIQQENWVVQEYVKPMPGLYQAGESSCESHDMVWGFFVFGSRYGGAWNRVMPQTNNKGVINCHQGATVSVIFEVDE